MDRNVSAQGQDPRHPYPPGVTPAGLALHNNFVAAMTALKRDLLRSVHYLRVIQERRVHRAFGYQNIYDYAQAAVGFSPGQTKALLLLGRNLERYPETKQALADGRLSWSKARLIVAKADPADERTWLEAARGLATGQLRKELVAAARPQAGRPEAAPVPALQRAEPRPPVVRPPQKLIVSYSLTPEQYARWERLSAALGAESREERLLAGLAARCVGGEDSGPEFLLVISECSRCRSAELVTSRGRFPVEQPLLLAAHCDAVVQDADGTRRATIPPRLRRRVLARDGHVCQGPGCRHTQHLEIHHRLPRALGGKTVFENLVTLCGRCHRELHRREEELREAGRDPCGG